MQHGIDIAQYFLEQGARFESKSQPEAIPFGVHVPDVAWPLFGRIVVLWTVLDARVDQLLWMLSLHHEVHPDAIGKPGDDLFRTKITFLEKEVGKKYADRPNVIREFARLKARCLMLKGVRDSIAHGQVFTADQPPEVGVVFRHKGKNKRYSLGDLHQAAQDISQCTGRLNEFHEWANWPTQKARLQQMQAFHAATEATATVELNPPVVDH